MPLKMPPKILYMTSAYIPLATSQLIASPAEREAGGNEVSVLSYHAHR